MAPEFRGQSAGSTKDWEVRHLPARGTAQSFRRRAPPLRPQDLHLLPQRFLPLTSGTAQSFRRGVPMDFEQKAAKRAKKEQNSPCLVSFASFACFCSKFFLQAGRLSRSGGVPSIFEQKAAKRAKKEQSSSCLVSFASFACFCSKFFLQAERLPVPGAPDLTAHAHHLLTRLDRPDQRPPWSLRGGQNSRAPRGAPFP